MPAEYYVVDGDTYDVTSFRAIVEDDGTDGFDAQVTMRPPSTTRSPR